MHQNKKVCDAPYYQIKSHEPLGSFKYNTLDQCIMTMTYKRVLDFLLLPEGKFSLPKLS